MTENTKNIIVLPMDQEGETVNQIYVYPDAITGLWMSQNLGPHAEPIIAAFGTNILPTAFMQPITGTAVCKVLESLNPDCHVDFFESESAWRAAEAARVAILKAAGIDDWMTTAAKHNQGKL